MNVRSLLIRAAVLAAALFTTTVSAQVVDTIVVTADRQPRALKERPGNTSLLDAEDLGTIRLDHISEALNRLPGVNIQRGSGQEHLSSIRSPVLTGGAGAGSFLYLEDNIALRAPGFANVNGLFEAVTELADGLEVVRGPGSAFHGSNAVHGLVNVLTPDPFSDPENVLQVRGGQFGRIQGSYRSIWQNGPDGYVAGVHAARDGGWRDSAGTTQAKGLLHWAHDGDVWRGGLKIAFNHLDQDTAGFVQGPEAYRDGPLARANAFPNAFRKATSVRVSAPLTRTISDDTSLSVTPYGRWADMTFLLHFLPSQALEENGHVSAGVQTELRWVMNDHIDVTSGIDVEATRGFLTEVQDRASFGSFPQGVHYDYTVGARVLAGYSQAQARLSEKTRMEAGVRIEHTRYAYDTNTPADQIGRFIRPADRTDQFTTVSPNLGLLHDISDTLQVYARYARGSRAPQTTDLYRLQINQTGPEAREEVLDSLEMGVRIQAGIFQAELAGFGGIKRNFFFRDADGFNVSNGRTRHVGVEWDVALAPLETLELRWAGTYARHTYRFDRPVNRASEVIVFGADVDTAPRWQGVGTVRWQPLDRLGLEAEWVWMGAYFMNAANTVRYPGHHVVNLRSSVAATTKLDVFIDIRNVTNTDYAERADFAFGNERYFPGEDRAISGGIRARF